MQQSYIIIILQPLKKNSICLLIYSCSLSVYIYNGLLYVHQCVETFCSFAFSYIVILEIKTREEIEKVRCQSTAMQVQSQTSSNNKPTKIGNTTSFLARLRSLRYGLMLCLNRNFTVVEVELDAKALVETLLFLLSWMTASNWHLCLPRFSLSTALGKLTVVPTDQGGLELCKTRILFCMKVRMWTSEVGHFSLPLLINIL